MFFIFNNAHHLSKKEKKKEQLRRNAMHQGLFAFARNRILGDSKKKEEKEKEEKLRGKKRDEKKKKDDKKEVWSEKVGTIRNRLNDKRRISEDRWNRFAGTEEGGGRGR